MTVAARPQRPGPVLATDIATVGPLSPAQVLSALAVDPSEGLTTAEAARRRAECGPNAVTSHRARFLPVLWRQLQSPLLWVLFAAAVASYFLGERSDAVIIAVIVAMSVGMGFGNEYRAEKAADALHEEISHRSTVLRDGHPVEVEVTELVPGDIVELHLGDIVPADIRLLEVSGLQCEESALTGESLPVDKQTGPTPPDTALAEQSGCALMGTVVHAGAATGVVVSTGTRTEFGTIAAGLSTHQLDTEFQLGLRKFSLLLVRVGAALTGAIFILNVTLHKPVLDALLFSLSIAVGITPQLLPAVVSTSLAAGSRKMRRLQVLVKRLVCIEDLGNIDVLFTDKTGTLTVGRIDFMRAVPARADLDPDALLRLGLLCTENTTATGQAAGGNPLDRALWESPAAAAARAAVAEWTRLDLLPFDHDRVMVSVLVRDRAGRRSVITKGAPEAVLRRCGGISDSARRSLDAEFAAGNRVVAVATKAAERPALTTDDEHDLRLAGFLVFLDPPKHDAPRALQRLADLGIAVKVVTGDNPAVARKVCSDLGLGDGAALTGADLDALDDDALAAAITTTTVFARVNPEQKARIVRVQRRSGGGVAFLGDGVNDALALHAADVGISVDSGTDIAKEAAEVILLEKSLHVLADGVTEGRRIFANTIKYVLMSSSSNFGNMFSAACASVFLPFLPMLPSQILLNNLLYDASQLAIPTDNVDEEQLHRPSHWDIKFIRRFMIFFGPLSSLFDFLTFAMMLGVFHAKAAEFHSGWFVESLATQTLVVFIIRTQRTPFFRSQPSVQVLLATLSVITIGALLPQSPIARTLGFDPLPGAFFAALAALAVSYLSLMEFGKHYFYRTRPVTISAPHRSYSPARHITRRAARFSTRQLPRTAPPRP